MKKNLLFGLLVSMNLLSCKTTPEQKLIVVSEKPKCYTAQTSCKLPKDCVGSKEEQASSILDGGLLICHPKLSSGNSEKPYLCVYCPDYYGNVLLDQIHFENLPS